MESSPMLDRRRPNGCSEPNGKSRVLVVGTTPDYVDLLRHRHPEECLFLTELRLRLHAKEPYPNKGEEVLYRRNRQLYTIELLKRHQKRYGIKVVGVVCFDCESMPLASFIAKRLGLPYPSLKAVHCCRNKRLTKHHWAASGTPNPRFSIVSRSEEAVEYLRRIGRSLRDEAVVRLRQRTGLSCRQRSRLPSPVRKNHLRSHSAPDCSTLPVLQGGASKRSDGGMD